MTKSKKERIEAYLDLLAEVQKQVAEPKLAARVVSELARDRRMRRRAETERKGKQRGRRPVLPGAGRRREKGARQGRQESQPSPAGEKPASDRERLPRTPLIDRPPSVFRDRDPYVVSVDNKPCLWAENWLADREEGREGRL